MIGCPLVKFSRLTPRRKQSHLAKALKYSMLQLGHIALANLIASRLLHALIDVMRREYEVQAVPPLLVSSL